MATTVLRAQLRSAPSNGYVAFLPQIRKLVVEYVDRAPSSANTRTFVLNHLEEIARENPHVEVVLRQRKTGHPILRGFYVNNRDKVIGLNGFEVTTIQKKAQLLLDSSGAKIKPLKKPVVSTTESARGIFSSLHSEPPSFDRGLRV